MKKLLSLLAIPVLLSACAFKSPFGSSTDTPLDGDTVTVDYVGTHDDGTEFDSSKKEGRTPLEFVIGRGGMIKGFEDNVRTMEAGETKKFRLEAKDAYGEEFIERTIPLSEYKEVVTQSVPSNALTGNLEQKVPKTQAEQLFPSLAVGTEKKIGEASVKILAIVGDDVTVSINDPKAPFYGKKLTAGLQTIAQDGSEITIKSIDEKTKNASVDIKQKQEVVSKTDKDITIKTKNPHPLAGKALNFEVTLLTVTKATPAPETPASSAAMEKTTSTGISAEQK